MWYKLAKKSQIYFYAYFDYNISTKGNMSMSYQLLKEKQIIMTSDIKKINITKPSFYKYLQKNDFIQVAHGIYAKKDTLIDPLLIINKRCPHAVFSHEEALYFYNLIDHEPNIITFTVYSGYNKTKLEKDGYKVFTVKKELVDLGKTLVNDHFENIIPIYDLERTICDLVRSRTYFENSDFNKALKSYAKRSDKNLEKLFEYAKKFNIEKILRKYMEVLL